MSSNCCCTKALGNFSDLMIPEGIIQRRKGVFFHDHPVLSRVIATPIALMSGIIKPFLFPLICAIGAIAIPVIALIRHCQHKGGGKDLMKIWAFCLLGLAVTALFTVGALYHLPLNATALLLATSIAISIIAHVNKLVIEPSYFYKTVI